MLPRALISLSLAVACGGLQAETLSYSRDIQPIFSSKCVACHACYDSPCQLNLGSGEGALRGASKLPVYNGERLKAQATTRLFFDAQGEQAWRRKGFNSVLDAQGAQVALMSRMLELGRSAPLAPNARLPADLDIRIDRDNQCPLPGEFDAYAKRFAHAGMPFAVTGLDDQEYATLQRWLAQGAPVDASPLAPSAGEQSQVEAWETLLNARGARETLVGRYLFEHLFLAHLYFEDGVPGHFFQVVRSRTPSGQPIDPIPTRRPNDDPGSDFYYRLWLVQDVIARKTHMTYPLDPQRLAHIRELFFANDWTTDRVPGYGAQHRANPFDTFAAIPARARYQFMLDNAEYFVRTFIRGPVCRGQIATDVIRDNFWVMFQQPGRDLYVMDPLYRAEATPLLAMPGQLDDIGDLLALWKTYRDKRNDYEKLRQKAYAKAPEPAWDDIWAGNDNALLTIFRHFDSATVEKGLIGEIPQTLWWMDYPLLERTYYQLVVNFDVFGNVSHQAQTRLYFDLIRNGAEANFLRLLPADSRKAILDSWYENSGRLKLWLDYQSIDERTASGLELPEKGAVRAFGNALSDRYPLIARADPINRCRTNCYRNTVPPSLQQAEQALSRLTGRLAGQLKAIERMPEATLLRVELDDGSREIYTLLRNRAHSNVAFLMGESLRYQPRLDTLTVHPGVLTNYPNFMFAMRAEEVPDFVAAMEHVADTTTFEHEVIERWGVRRSHPQFWRLFHDLSDYIRETEPVEAGVLDMNRFENL
jgi:hypothetical protein